MKAVQYFSAEYLERCKKMKPIEILEFLESFRLLHAPKSPSKLISMKVPENLLSAFKRRCQLSNIPYQTQLKRLMKHWLEYGEWD
jgi:predicted DNA binding CopG/RHH family protein